MAIVGQPAEAPYHVQDDSEHRFLPPDLRHVRWEPGGYTIRMRYRTDALDPESWTGNAMAANPQELSAGLVLQLARVPALNVVSNGVSVAVRDG